MSQGNYCFDDVVAALKKVGLHEGATVYGHVGLLKLGIPAEVYDGKNPFDVLFDGIMHVLGPTGTFLTPTYTYSFCNGEVYSPKKSPSAIGPFGNKFLKQKGVSRSLDPIFSVAGIGPRAQTLLSNLPNDSFGRGSFYQRLEEENAILCNMGVDLFYSTCIHHIEQLHEVPHRFLKLFSGIIETEARSWRTSWVYNVRVLGAFSFPRFDRLQDAVLGTGACLKAELGTGNIHAVRTREYYAKAREMLAVNPMCFAENPEVSPVEETDKSRTRREFSVSLSPESSMRDVVAAMADLPRDIVSDGYDAAIEALAAAVPMTIHSYPTGKEYFTWIAPEKWTCRDAYVADLSGNRLFSYCDHPLHVVSYSLPVDKVVSREELFAHLYTHHALPDAIPFKFKYYERDWGFCCSARKKESLTEPEYRVRIDSDFSYGAVKVGEVVAKGASSRSFVFCAHLCHPAQVNDDVSGVAVGIEVMRALQKMQGLRNTYRMLILPETVGSAAWLSKNEDLISDLTGGMFLEMLARPAPHALQRSLQGDSQADKVCQCVLREFDPASWDAPFMQVILNDERMFNSPGIDVPMLSLSRCLPKGDPEHPYREYHTNLDNIAHADFSALEQSVELVLNIVRALEANRIPVRAYKGELFCSRFAGVDYGAMFRYIHSVPYKMDGKRTVADIAIECGFGFFEVLEFLKALEMDGLIHFV